MKKILSLLALIVLSCMGAWAQVTHLASFNFSSEDITAGQTRVQKTQNDVTIEVVTAVAGGFGSGTSGVSITSNELTALNNNVNESFFTDDNIKSYISAGAKTAASDITITLSNLTAGTAYNVSFVTGFNSQDSGTWNAVRTTNSYTRSSTNLNAETVKRAAPTSYVVTSMIANNEGKIVLTIDASGVHLPTFNALAIAEVPKTPATAEEIETLQNRINEVFYAIADSKVGYPYYNEETDTPQANIDAVNNLAEFALSVSVDADNYDEAEAALDAVYALTAINLPKAGKAYKMYFQCSTNNSSKKYYVKNSGTTLTQDSNEAAIVVMGISGTADRCFYFADGTTGNYMQFRGFENNGSATYNATTNLFSIKPLVGASNGEATGRSKEERFGLVYMSAAGRPGENGVGGMVVNESTGVFDRTADPFFNGAHTSAMVFEEVEFPYTTKTLNNGGDGKNYATVALPYAMEIPAGVKAYAATENGDVLVLTDATATSQNVAKGAYILVSESETSAAVLPAAANPTAVDNDLQGSITTVPSGSLYVLNKTAEEGVGFYKFNGDYNTLLGKAYLPSSAAANKLSFRFEDVVTAISAIEGNSKNVEIFDLQGRRLEKAQKGMNIINGRKVLVK